MFLDRINYQKKLFRNVGKALHIYLTQTETKWEQLKEMNKKVNFRGKKFKEYDKEFQMTLKN